MFYLISIRNSSKKLHQYYFQMAFSSFPILDTKFNIPPLTEHQDIHISQVTWGHKVSLSADHKASLKGCGSS